MSKLKKGYYMYLECENGSKAGCEVGVVAYELLAKGYRDMAKQNLAMSDEGAVADIEALELYEEKLTECE